MTEPEEVELPELSDMQRLALEPDDILVVRTERRVTLEQADTVKQRLARFGIDPDRVLVLGDGTTLAVVKVTS